ncbi:hypothetical protein Shell_1094 [Staphylothermus hellenicus DSM 12710]|uniref:Uncharacterized protein n=2 Tax=Staphylothermus hellenicus TaxID=84599 RepID=D7D8V1_STAHD|nr:hypothetical protein Shell_1094 [Staphylothermus hellenicus DSM 12710]
MVFVMAYTWEPKWEKYRVEVDGIILYTCRDKITGMIACPICIHAASTCLDLEKRRPRNYPVENSFFFSPYDLIIHIREYHARGLNKKYLASSEKKYKKLIK